MTDQAWDLVQRDVRPILGAMRKNTLYALALLLIAITLAGFLGVLRIWSAGG